MNKNLLIISLLFLFVSADSSYFAKEDVHQDNTNYVLVFSDEFDQPNGSQPDSKKWRCCIRYVGTGWNRWISPSPDVAFIKNGHLVCRAIPNPDLRTDTATMLTGAIETYGKFSFQYGKVEVRMKTNNKRGNFPAAWMKSEKNDPNRYGEIDIVEMFGNQGLAQQTIHNHKTTILKKGRAFNVNKRIPLNKWHVYTVEWTPEKLIFLIDGKVTGEFKKSNNSQDIAEGQWTFDCPFYIRLNQSVGNGNYECMIPNTNGIYETQFDWVRVYQKKKKVTN
ncbi:MAG: glycoside hydrolase family 16 protein [Bacteroidaceae bacterium]|nr:glycoside hydrolase family 16 protein [Bacteroidaceae bacterium]